MTRSLGASAAMSVDLGFGVKMRPDLARELVEGGIAEHVERTRARQGNLVDRLDGAGPRGHDDDAVGEENRFGNRMRDQEDGFRRLEMDALQFEIHMFPRHR